MSRYTHAGRNIFSWRLYNFQNAFTTGIKCVPYTWYNATFSKKKYIYIYTCVYTLTQDWLALIFEDLYLTVLHILHSPLLTFRPSCRPLASDLGWKHCVCVRNFQTGTQSSHEIDCFCFIFNFHSGETDEANCSWLHPVWPPPKRPDQINTFCMVSRASTDLIFCIHRDFDVRNNVCKPRRLVCKCCRDIRAWKSRVMKPSVLRDPSRMKPTEYRDEANWFSNWADEANCW